MKVDPRGTLFNPIRQIAERAPPIKGMSGKELIGRCVRSLSLGAGRNTPLGAVTKTDVHLIDLDMRKREERVPPVNLHR
jgi:hypothetical protein